MRLPNAALAIVELEKLRDYCLSTDHPRGRHKARVFRRRLGLGRDEAPVLRDALLTAARREPARKGVTDAWGTRYVLDFAMRAPGGSAIIRSHWIVRHDEGFPRLTSCHVR